MSPPVSFFLSPRMFPLFVPRAPRGTFRSPPSPLVRRRRYLEPRPGLRRWLEALRHAGRRLFVCTNSHLDYSDFTMTHALGPDWRSAPSPPFLRCRWNCASPQIRLEDADLPTARCDGRGPVGSLSWVEVRCSVEASPAWPAHCLIGTQFTQPPFSSVESNLGPVLHPRPPSGARDLFDVVVVFALKPGFFHSIQPYGTVAIVGGQVRGVHRPGWEGGWGWRGGGWWGP